MHGVQLFHRVLICVRFKLIIKKNIVVINSLCLFLYQYCIGDT